MLTNSQTGKLFGYEPSELIGQSVEVLVPPRFRMAHYAHRTGFLGEPEARPMGAGRDLYGLRKDGSEFPVEIGLNPIATESGTWVLSAVADITERKRLEGELRKLAEIVESSDDAIFSEQLDGTITSWNLGAEKTYGYPAAEMIGRSATILAPPDRAHEIPDLLARIGRGEFVQQYITKRQRQDGTPIDVSLTISPVKNERGEVIAAAVVARDITSQMRAAEQVAQLNADLEQTNASLARTNQDLEHFAFVASHDLQEPLRMITAYAQLLVKTYPPELDQEAATFVGNIVDGTMRMRQLLADLLTYTQVSAGPEGDSIPSI